jgi:hypothetical protein
MLNFVKFLSILYFRVYNPVFVIEKRRQVTAANIAIFIYRGGQNRALILLKPHRVIGSPSKERDSERRLTDNHKQYPCWFEPPCSEKSLLVKARATV